MLAEHGRARSGARRAHRGTGSRDADRSRAAAVRRHISARSSRKRASLAATDRLAKACAKEPSVAGARCLEAEAERLSRSVKRRCGAVALYAATTALVAARRRRCSSAYERHKAARGAARLRRSRPEDARPAAPARHRALGAVQARWRARPHPDRRGAGHQSRAMGDRAAALAEEFFAGEGARDRVAHGLRGRRRQAVDLQLPARRPARLSSRMREHFAGARRQRATAVARRAARHLVPLDRRRAARGRCGVRAARRRRRASRSTAPRSATSPPAPAMPGWSSCGRRSRRRGRAEPEPWEPPLDAARRARAARPARARDRRDDRRLARRPASGSRRATAPIRPGDIMVLVRRRNAFVGDLLRALKQRDVPVAGADRMMLTEQLAVQDLVALGAFPAVAGGRSDPGDGAEGAALRLRRGELFELAHGRGNGSLWHAAARRAGERARLRRAPSSCSARCWPAPISCRPTSSSPRSSARGGGRRAMLRAARARGGRPDRGVPRAGARL